MVYKWRKKGGNISAGFAVQSHCGNCKSGMYRITTTLFALQIYFITRTANLTFSEIFIFGQR